VWRDLVVDPKGTHYHRMGSAIWLFLYLILHADRATGRVFRKVATIAREMGMSQRTVGRWLKILRVAGYVGVHNTGRYLLICVHLGERLWTSCGQVHREKTEVTDQMGQTCPSRVAKDDRPPEGLHPSNVASLSHKSATPALPVRENVKESHKKRR